MLFPCCSGLFHFLWLPVLCGSVLPWEWKHRSLWGSVKPSNTLELAWTLPAIDTILQLPPKPSVHCSRFRTVSINSSYSRCSFSKNVSCRTSVTKFYSHKRKDILERQTKLVFNILNHRMQLNWLNNNASKYLCFLEYIWHQVFFFQNWKNIKH